MPFPTSILFLLSLLPATPLSDLKAPDRPPIASLSPGLPNPSFTLIETRAGEDAGYSVSCYPLQGRKTGGGFERLRATKGVWSTQSQIVLGPWHGPDELWPGPRDEHDQAFSLGTDCARRRERGRRTRGSGTGLSCLDRRSRRRLTRLISGFVPHPPCPPLDRSNPIPAWSPSDHLLPVNHCA